MPGMIALYLCPDILKYLSLNVENVVFITGTNGKTSVNNLTKSVLSELIKDEKTNNVIVCNNFGSNMERGIISAFIKKRL